jgi:Ca2+-binding EF-hand superfamily protein
MIIFIKRYFIEFFKKLLSFLSALSQLDRDEFEKMIKKLGVEHERIHLAGVFKKINVSRSGSIVFQEFYDFIFNTGLA